MGREGHFVWTDGNPVVYTYFDYGEPNNGGGEDCVLMNYSPPYWNDYGCEYSKHFICKATRKNSLPI